METNITVVKLDTFNVGQEIVIAKTPVLTEKDLKDGWIDYRNQLIQEYQIEEKESFTRWNFYLFYVVNDKNKINRSLKYEVEHNTISSRQIVVNADEANDGFSTLIEKYIKFTIGPDNKNDNGIGDSDCNPRLFKMYEDENKES